MDEYDEWEKEQKNKNKFHFKIFEKVKPLYIVFLAVLFLVGNQIAKSNQSKWVWFVLGGLVILFILSMIKQGAKAEPIPRHIAQAIAQHDIEREIAAGRIFSIGTKVTPTGYFKDQIKIESGGEPILLKYNFGFKIKPKDKPEIDIVYQMEPFTGRAKGWIEKPLGFTGEDIKDIQIIMPERIIEEKEPKK